jgi:phosphohistidine phosphatase SixA
MKSILALITFLLLIAGCKTTNIYVVRHGEKASQPADNPHLTEEGNTRAAALKDLLADKNIKHVFSTNFHRTMQTATPLATSKGLQIQMYKSDTTGKFVQRLMNLNENALVVGHSNSVLVLLDSFGVQRNIRTIPETDYDNLFIISLKNGKVVGLKETTYGEATQ